MTFQCESCGWTLPVGMQAVTVDISTGDVKSEEPETIIQDSEKDLPPCPNCGSDIEYTEETGQ